MQSFKVILVSSAGRYYWFFGIKNLLGHAAWLEICKDFSLFTAQADAGVNKSRNIPDALAAGHTSSSLKGGAGSTLENYHQY